MTLGQPLVVLESKPSAKKSEDICFVRQDNYGGARTLAKHLIEVGARRLVHLVPKLSWPAIAERRRGVESALRGVRGTSLAVVTSGEGFEETQAALDAYLEHNAAPDAVMGANDQMGIAAMRLLIARGHRVPQDVMVTGFNAFEFRRYTNPVLTSVISSAYDIGSRAGAELLHRLIHGTFAKSDILLPTAFIAGESTASAKSMRAQPQRKAPGR